MPQLAPTQKARAVPRKNEGLIIALIARGLNFSHSATKFATDRCKGSGFFDSGKPKIFTDGERRVLRYYVVT
ncbi:hypothetical protein INT47_011471 [Mucor saturninus]|uniref:Uncharacterized protein n=1 Tax=Mucor saturninus TaxID=64648 RepID=A0A8H7QEE1_9FUNG|nr:hypothetical protein INT47_011471 [Mucor saturninus]